MAKLIIGRDILGRLCLITCWSHSLLPTRLLVKPQVKELKAGNQVYRSTEYTVMNDFSYINRNTQVCQLFI